MRSARSSRPRRHSAQALGYLHRQWPRLLLFLEDGNIELTNNRRERELRRSCSVDATGSSPGSTSAASAPAHILSIIATCIAHDVNPRAYLHLVTKLIVQGWPQASLRELLPDRMLAAHPELFAGDHDVLSAPVEAPALDA